MYNNSLHKLQVMQNDHMYDPLMSAASLTVFISPRVVNSKEVKKNKFQLRRESMAAQTKHTIKDLRVISPPEISEDKAYQRFLSQLSQGNRTMNSVQFPSRIIGNSSPNRLSTQEGSTVQKAMLDNLYHESLESITTIKGGDSVQRTRLLSEETKERVNI